MGSMMKPGAWTVRCRGDDVLWILGSLCRMFRIPFDQGLAAVHCPPCCGNEHLLRMLQAFGFTVGVRSMSPGKLTNAPMPVIGFLRGTDQQHPGDDPAPKPNAEVERDIPLLIVRANQENLLLFRPGSNHPESLPLSEAETSLEGHVLLLGRKPSADAGLDPEARVNAEGCTKFGFRWFIPELLKFKCIWRDVLTASLFIQLIGLGTPLFTQVIIDKVVVHQARNTLFVVATGMAVFMVFSALMTWLRQYLVLHTGTRIDASLCCKVFAHLVRLPMPYFEARSTGTLLARIQGVESIRQFVSGAAVTLVLDCPFLLVFMAVMFWYSWQLSLVALGILILITFLSALVTPVFRRCVNRQFLLGARNQAFVTEYLAGMDTVKALQMEPGLDERYGEYLAAYLEAGFATRQLANSYTVAANLLEQTMTLSILGAGALLVMGHNGFTIGQLVAFQMFATRMSQPMLRLVGLWQEFQQANIAVKRLGDIMDMPAEPHGLVPSRLRSVQPGRVELRDVSFRYGPGHPYVFRNLNLAFEPGKLSVLMGPSGCGKSTLAKLLLGFWQPTDGRVTIDGRDIRHMSANELRMLFGVVPQDTVLFSGTIYDNLLHANPHAGFEDVVMVCRHAGIHEVIEALPQGYQTQLGEHGVGLSGGQRQRIAIARALLKRPCILIFDEATSGLDQLAAERFAATVNSLKGQATMIFITHQVPNGLQVDELFRFEPGMGEQRSGSQP